MLYNMLHLYMYSLICDFIQSYRFAPYNNHLNHRSRIIYLYIIMVLPVRLFFPRSISTIIHRVNNYPMRKKMRAFNSHRAYCFGFLIKYYNVIGIHHIVAIMRMIMLILTRTPSCIIQYRRKRISNLSITKGGISTREGERLQ